MKIIFFGSGDFAVLPLKALISSGHNIACAVTQPDKEKGRGLLVLPTAVKASAQRNDLLVYQPDNINTPESIAFLRKFNPDLFIVIAYGQILSQEALSAPRLFALNAHASLLPKYRGAAPINWSIINGEKETGVTLMKMARGIDSGEIILQKKINISNDDTAATLEDKLSKLAAEALNGALIDIQKNNYRLAPQDKSQISLAPKLKKDDGLINWGNTAVQIYNLIRGVLPWPGAFTHYRGKLLKIFGAKECQSVKVSKCQRVSVPGEIVQVSKTGLIVATGEGDLIITELQLEGKKRMAVGEFIRGHKICVGEKLGVDKIVA